MLWIHQSREDLPANIKKTATGNMLRVSFWGRRCLPQTGGDGWAKVLSPITANNSHKSWNNCAQWSSFRPNLQHVKVAVRRELWSAHTKESHVTITFHFTQNWDLKTTVKQTRSTDEEHTTENITDQLKAVAKQRRTKVRAALVYLCIYSCESVV